MPSLLRQRDLKEVTLYSSDYSLFLPSLDGINTIQTLNIFDPFDLAPFDGVAWSRMTPFFFHSLKRLDTELDLSGQEFLEFIKSFPVLESLCLRYICPDSSLNRALSDYILAAPCLLDFSIVFDCDIGGLDREEEARTLFFELAMKSNLTSIDIIPAETQILSSNQVISILEHNQTASTLHFAGSKRDVKEWKDGNRGTDAEQNAISLNRSINSFWHRINYYQFAFALKRSESDWNQVTGEAVSLLSNIRIISTVKRTSRLRLPIEIIEPILSFTQSHLWIPEQLRVIIRCLRDRRSLGKIRSEVVKFDKNVLYVRCKRVLAQL